MVVTVITVLFADVARSDAPNGLHVKVLRRNRPWTAATLNYVKVGWFARRSLKLRRVLDRQQIIAELGANGLALVGDGTAPRLVLRPQPQQIQTSATGNLRTCRSLPRRSPFFHGQLGS